jgi:hypothetical protein
VQAPAVIYFCNRIKSFYVVCDGSIRRKVKFVPVSASWVNVNTQSMQERPFLKPFCFSFRILSAV